MNPSIFSNSPLCLITQSNEAYFRSFCGPQWQFHRWQIGNAVLCVLWLGNQLPTTRLWVEKNDAVLCRDRIVTNGMGMVAVSSVFWFRLYTSVGINIMLACGCCNRSTSTLVCRCKVSTGQMEWNTTSERPSPPSSSYHGGVS
jgi:hypothetical protein